MSKNEIGAVVSAINTELKRVETGQVRETLGHVILMQAERLHCAPVGLAEGLRTWVAENQEGG